MADKTTNILLAGVGGQGVILASFLLSQAGLEAGYDVKQSEVHGMAQRGGSVVSHLRLGEKVWSPLFTPGTVDVLLSFEALETLRYLHWAAAGASVVYNTLRINPSTVASGMAVYPETVEDDIKARFPNAKAIDAAAIAKESGNPRTQNLALLGALSQALDIDDEVWQKVMSRELPAKILEPNLKAFALGRAAVAEPVR